MTPGKNSGRHVTLGMTVVLHAFTHGYGTLLVPLYLLMRDDLGTPGVNSIALIVAIYGVVYASLSYYSGVLADRFNRKNLLGIGLIGNGAAIALMGLTRRYELLVLLGVLGGLFGTLFHPAANALIPAHYPKKLGIAIGLLGIGSGLGFFAGPQFAGWRADVVGSAGRYGLSAWQVPCLEAGSAGVLFGLAFLLFAKEAHHETSTPRQRVPLDKALRNKVLLLTPVLGCRDFSGIAAISLVSIYLQKAHGYDTQQAGFVVGSMMLISMFANPVAVAVSNGKRRLPMLGSILAIGGAMLAAVPFVPVAALLPFLAVYQVFHLGSYALSETSMLERVDPAVRGRVIGLFISVAGTFASTSPWVMGLWTDLLGERALRPDGYVLPFLVLGLMMLFASLSARMIATLSDKEPTSSVQDPGVLQGLDPTMEAIG